MGNIEGYAEFLLTKIKIAEKHGLKADPFEVYYIPSTWATLCLIFGPGMALAALVAIVWAVVKVVEAV